MAENRGGSDLFPRAARVSMIEVQNHQALAIKPKSPSAFIVSAASLNTYRILERLVESKIHVASALKRVCFAIRIE
jgi:hypothetical protein